MNTSRKAPRDLRRKSLTLDKSPVVERMRTERRGSFAASSVSADKHDRRGSIVHSNGLQYSVAKLVTLSPDLVFLGSHLVPNKCHLATCRNSGDFKHRKLPSICSYWLRENPGKNLNQVICPDRESNPSHLVSRPDVLTVTPQFTNIIRNLKSRRLRWAGHVARMGESRNAYRVLVGRPEGKRPLGRPRRRWEDNIKMDLREVGYDDRDWLNLAQDRDRWRAYVRAAMNLRVP
ncbi:hypothetical protein ANN_18952 [Periplaneta americana]|uniref:Uncharacterized protein n=1 Tax=Periplaneta americana TaxID=6978 RepID=A0ABQ8SRG8_PERAM|nr:hypothetical protein ANN_18952 [Periplaneta americana]